jgi:hypothetical protein
MNCAKRSCSAQAACALPISVEGIMIWQIMLLMGPDLPLNFHPAAIRVSAGSTPSSAGGATCDRRSCSGLRSRSHVAVRLVA